MQRRSAFVTDLMVLLGALAALALVLGALAWGLPRLGVSLGAAPVADTALAGDSEAAPAPGDAQPPAAQTASENAQPATSPSPAGQEEGAAEPMPPGNGTPRGRGAGRMAAAGEGALPSGDAQVPAPISTDAQPGSASVQEPAAASADAPADATPADAVMDSPAQSSSGLIAVTGAQGADLYDRPQGSAYAALPAGSVLTALGRNEDGSWLLVQQDAVAGWVEASRLVIFDAATLPVLPASDQPLVAPPATAAAAPAPPVDSSALPATATPAPQAEAALITAVVATDDTRLNVRSGPGAEYAVVTQAKPGARFTALARSGDDAWVQLALPETPEGAGWVSAEYIALSAPLAELPISSLPAAAPAPAAPPDPADPPADPPEAEGTTSLLPSDSGLSGTLAFMASNGGMIYAYDLQSGALTPLTHGFDPAISPDGGTVAFTRDGGENGVYLIDRDGSNQRLIYSGRQRLAAPKWSPDGSEIVFSRGDEVQRCYMLGPGGCIPEEEAGNLVGPDGKLIKLDPDTLTTQVSFMLSVIDPNGNGFHDLPALTSARAADWNEDGVVYQSNAGLQITSDEPNAQNRLVIFNNLKPFFHDPDWQPNGGAIVYQGKEASHWEIFKVNPDGSGKVALTRPSTTLVAELPSNVAPAWSPDGAWIVFLSNRSDNGEAGAWRLWVMDADGANQRPLPLDTPITYTFGDEQVASWAG